MQLKNIVKFINHANKNDLNQKENIRQFCISRHPTITEITKCSKSIGLPKNGILETRINLSNNQYGFSSKRYFNDKRDDDSNVALNMLSKYSQHSKFRMNKDVSTHRYYLEDSYPPEYKHHDMDIFHYLSKQHKNKEKVLFKHLQPQHSQPYGSDQTLYYPACTRIKPSSTAVPLSSRPRAEYENLPNQKHLPKKYVPGTSHATISIKPLNPSSENDPRLKSSSIASELKRHLSVESVPHYSANIFRESEQNRKSHPPSSHQNDLGPNSTSTASELKLPLNTDPIPHSSSNILKGSEQNGKSHPPSSHQNDLGPNSTSTASELKPPLNTDLIPHSSSNILRGNEQNRKSHPPFSHQNDLGPNSTSTGSELKPSLNTDPVPHSSSNILRESEQNRKSHPPSLHKNDLGPNFTSTASELKPPLNTDPVRHSSSNILRGSEQNRKCRQGALLLVRAKQISRRRKPVMLIPTLTTLPNKNKESNR